MILMIDNYDSFVYNLVQYIGELGEEIVVKRNNEITVEEIETLDPEIIVLSPGPCSPTEAGICIDVVNYFKGKKPILGICLGHQTIGHVFGGKVVKALILSVFAGFFSCLYRVGKKVEEVEIIKNKIN